MELIGQLLRNVHAGEQKLLYFCSEIAPVPETIQVRSSAFLHQSEIPQRYTPLGDNVSPQLSWSEIPANARSIVLVVEDPDAPLPRPFVHAIVYNLPPDGEVPEGALPTFERRAQPVPTEFRLGKNTFGKLLFRGPSPVADHGPHRYYFQVFALDTTLTFHAPPRRNDIADAMNGHVLAKGLLIGTFERRSVPLAS